MEGREGAIVLSDDSWTFPSFAGGLALSPAFSLALPLLLFHLSMKHYMNLCFLLPPSYLLL